MMAEMKQLLSNLVLYLLTGLEWAQGGDYLPASGSYTVPLPVFTTGLPASDQMCPHLLQINQHDCLQIEDSLL
jgi:hypothetical protein